MLAALPIDTGREIMEQVKSYIRLLAFKRRHQCDAWAEDWESQISDPPENVIKEIQRKGPKVNTEAETTKAGTPHHLLEMTETWNWLEMAEIWAHFSGHKFKVNREVKGGVQQISEI